MPHKARIVPLLAVLLAAVALVLLLVSGPGTRLELWGFRTGFSLMRWAVYIGLAGAALGLVSLLLPALRRAGAIPAAVALVLGLAVAYVPWAGLQKARSVPPIHDISTDTTEPPAFVALLPVRLEAPNGAEYAGEDIARQQREAYPEIQPLRLELAPAQAFEQALAAARDMGWEIADADRGDGRIEATDTTFWYGFKDDVVIRVRADGSGSRIDVRSMSRLGGSDVGANAERIRRYLARIERD
jgi:uncharacterized protein (DUF1499 family)